MTLHIVLVCCCKCLFLVFKSCGDEFPFNWNGCSFCVLVKHLRSPSFYGFFFIWMIYNVLFLKCNWKQNESFIDSHNILIVFCSSDGVLEYSYAVRMEQWLVRKAPVGPFDLPKTIVPQTLEAVQHSVFIYIQLSKEHVSVTLESSWFSLTSCRRLLPPADLSVF